MESWEDTCPVAAIQIRPREDELWMLTCGVLVIQMQAAFALIEAGSVRSMNLVNIMMKNMIDLTLGGVIWYLIGDRIATNPGGQYTLEIADPSHWFFNWAFAATCSTIISGVVAERISFMSYIVVSIMMTGLVYPAVAYWVWHPDGFLHKRGFLDFAGGGGVHLLGASASLVASCMLGPRIGRFSDYVPRGGRFAAALMRRSQDPHYYMLPVGTPELQPVTDSVSLIFGVFFLWVGWYGFNPGSTLGTDGAKTYVAGMVTVNTTLGAIGGAFFESIKSVFLYKARFTPEGLSVAVLAGLVSVTSGCPWLYNRDAFALGFLGAMVASLVKRALSLARIDDVVSAIPIHGGAGLVGTVGLAVFAREWPCNGEAGFDIQAGILYSSAEGQQKAWEFLATQLGGCICIMVIAFTTMFLLIALLNQIPPLRLRIDRDIELYGIDEAEHGTSHDEVDFKALLEDVIHVIASGTGSPGEMHDAFQAANRCLQLQSEMDKLKSKRSTQSPGTELRVTVQRLAGDIPSSDPASRYDRHEFRVRVKLVLAIPPVGDNHPGMTLHTFCPHMTTKPHSRTQPMRWDETFKYHGIRIPVGCRRNAFVLLSVLRGGHHIGRAYVSMLPFAWPEVAVQRHEGEGIACDMQLELFPADGADEGRLPTPCALHVRLCYPYGTQDLSETDSHCVRMYDI